MTTISIRGISLFVKVIGRGYPLAILHGGPGGDHTTMLNLRPLADHFTLVFYDHRCNGHSTGADVASFTWENLAADAEALRQALGFSQWAMLGHSLGGMVALEVALRYPERLSHLVLMDTGGDLRWAQENAPRLLAERGYPADVVETARSFLNGQIEPDELLPSLMKLSNAYNPHLSLLQLPRIMISALGGKFRAEGLIHGYGGSLRGWNVMDRLSQIQTPTLVLAGRDDFIFPPEHQEALAAGIPNARLVLVDRAGHNPQLERSAETIQAIRHFMATTNVPAGLPTTG